MQFPRRKSPYEVHGYPLNCSAPLMDSVNNSFDLLWLQLNIFSQPKTECQNVKMSIVTRRRRLLLESIFDAISFLVVLSLAQSIHSHIYLPCISSIQLRRGERADAERKISSKAAPATAGPLPDTRTRTRTKSSLRLQHMQHRQCSSLIGLYVTLGTDSHDLSRSTGPERNGQLAHLMSSWLFLEWQRNHEAVKTVCNSRDKDSPGLFFISNTNRSINN